MEKVLPEAWEWKTLGDLIDFVIGGDWGKDVDDESESDWMIVKCIRGSELKNWNKEKGLTAAFRKIKPTSLATRKLKAGDIILEISGGGPEQPVGRTVLIDNSVLFIDSEYPKVCTNFFRLLRPSNEVNSYFLNYYLTFFYLSGEVIKYQGGSNNLRNLKFKEYEQIPIPIPPLPEQQRIAARLDVLMEQLENAKKALAAFPDLIKSFRQAVLAQAVSGRLTEDWREGEMDWEETCIHELLISLDQGWSPKCENFPSINNEKWGVIKTSSVIEMCFIENENKQLPENLKPKSQYEIKENDILITRAGPRVRVGICCVVRYCRPRLMICDKVYRMRVNQSKIIPTYLELVLNSPEKVIEIDKLKTGISDSGLNLTQNKVREIAFPLPPLSEQEEIVRRVERLFAYADSLEQQYAALQEKLAILPQAILAKAFRGEI